MPELIAETIRTARKEHNDCSFEWIEYANLQGLLTFSELKAIAEARKRNWKILPGMKYVHQVVKQEEQIYDYKSLPELVAICMKAHLWGNV